MHKTTNKTYVFKLGLLLLASCFYSTITTAGEENSLQRTYYNPWEREIGYAPVVKVGNVLYLSGVTSEGETMEEQTEKVYTAIGKILAEHGAGFSDVAKETVFTTDIEALKKASPIRKKFYKDQQDPASSWVQIDQLFLEDRMLEVEVMAIIPAQ